MNASRRVLAQVLLLTVFSLEQVLAQEAEEHWITRPPYFRKFPSSVYICMSSSPDQFCTGTLLSPLWVLTAARCMLKDGNAEIVEKDTSITVHAGVDDRADLNGETVQNRSSVKLILHQDSTHSLALIKLDRAVDTLFDVVEPAVVSVTCIKQVEDSVCTSGSYGIHGHGIKYMQFDLRTCQCHKELKENYPDELEDKWICGQYGQCVEICKGDYGLGMMCDGNLQAVGIDHALVEDNAPCKLTGNRSSCDPGYTKGLYVDLCYYNDWLRTFVPSIERAGTLRSQAVSTLMSPTTTCSVCWVLLWFLTDFIAN